MVKQVDVVGAVEIELSLGGDELNLVGGHAGEARGGGLEAEERRLVGVGEGAEAGEGGGGGRRRRWLAGEHGGAQHCAGEARHFRLVDERMRECVLFGEMNLGEGLGLWK